MRYLGSFLTAIDGIVVRLLLRGLRVLENQRPNTSKVYSLIQKAWGT